MNATDIVGWVVDGALYCDDCFPGDRKDAHPVFCGEDAVRTCDECHEWLMEPIERQPEELYEFIRGAWHGALFTFGAWSDNPNSRRMFGPGNEPDLPENAWSDALDTDCQGFLMPAVCHAIRENYGDGFYHAGTDFHLSRNNHGSGLQDGPAPWLHREAKPYGDNELMWDDVLPVAGPKGDRAPEWQVDAIETYLEASDDWRGWALCAEYEPDEWLDCEGRVGDGLRCESPEEWEAREHARGAPWVAYMAMSGYMDTALISRGATMSEALHALASMLGDGSWGPRELTAEAYATWQKENDDA